MAGRPKSRERRITGATGSVKKRGSGLGKGSRGTRLSPKKMLVLAGIYTAMRLITNKKG